MEAKKKTILAVVVAVALVVISGILAYPMLSSTKPVQNVNNLLVDGGFESQVCFQPGAGVIQNTSQQCTSAWEVSTNYSTIPADTVSQLTSQNPRSGNFAIEFMVHDEPFSLGVSARQGLKGNGCAVDSGQSFGVKMQNGLIFSFWYREMDLGKAFQSATVVFHNGTSKLAVTYNLGPSTIVGYQVHGLNLSSRFNEADVDVYLNSSSSEWKQSTFDLYHEFIKYFGIDPISNQYCINYVAVGEGVKASPMASGGSRAIHYAYFDDVELYINQNA